ncbi:hypothetical protein E6C27_scaffold40G001670 [Cucumis melo var. makuwa]|uniref:Uncharacterized protein n=1 Tax=Cucumis melo var. makuwa TaxID=1194695 RepID=A0A5A7VHB8_CUCMM|nr:hypothetical protein E6C27_scaffold40G001670 [Cucumis melo var. makuwa]
MNVFCAMLTDLHTADAFFTASRKCSSYDIAFLTPLSASADLQFFVVKSSWVIDSGASIHATSKKEFFASYTLVILAVLGWAMMDQQIQLASEMYTSRKEWF